MLDTAKCRQIRLDMARLDMGLDMADTMSRYAVIGSESPDMARHGQIYQEWQDMAGYNQICPGIAKLARNGQI